MGFEHYVEKIMEEQDRQRQQEHLNAGAIGEGKSTDPGCSTITVASREPTEHQRRKDK